MPDQYDVQKEHTRQKIYDAFYRLILDTPYHEITVRGIAKEADIGFRTFYHHYEGKEALAASIVEEALSILGTVIQPSPTLDDHVSNVRRVLHAVTEAPSIIRILGRLPERETYLKPLIAFAKHDLARTRDNTLPPFRAHLIGVHFAMSQFQLIYEWVEAGQPMPIEDFADVIMHLIIAPVWESSLAE